MSAAHVHLLLNHVPILASGFALFFLLVAGIGRSGRHLAASGEILLLFALETGIAAYLTGEPAEDVVEGMPGVRASLIETHAQRALPAAAITAIAGGLALAALFARTRRRQPAPALVRMVTVAALLSFLSLSYAGHAGGLIHHPEAGGGAAVTGAAGDDEAGESE